MTTVLCELQALRLVQPGLHATAAEVATWYERKARLMDLVAATSTGPEVSTARRQASAARAHADRLLLAAVVGVLPRQGKASAVVPRIASTAGLDTGPVPGEVGQ